MPFDIKRFPNLHPGNYRSNDPAVGDDLYNCIAWAAGYSNRIWDPIAGEPKELFYWPEGVDENYHINTLVKAFESEGYLVLTDDGKPVDGTLQDGIEKIALYADDDEYMHASRQLECGNWTSKMGRFGERIEHDTPEDVSGPAYGQVAKFMQRNRKETVSP